MRRYSLATIAAGAAASLLLAVPADATLTLCGVSDQSAGDSDAAVGVVATTCDLGTGMFSGSASESNLGRFDQISITGLLEGFGTVQATNSYSFRPSAGLLSVSLAGRRDPADGFGQLAGLTLGSTFHDNPAAVIPPFAPDGSFDASAGRGGFFDAGPGILTARINFNNGSAGPQASITVSGVFSAIVPEPSSWGMMLGGFAFVGGIMRARRRTWAAA